MILQMSPLASVKSVCTWTSSVLHLTSHSTPCPSPASHWMQQQRFFRETLSLVPACIPELLHNASIFIFSLNDLIWQISKKGKSVDVLYFVSNQCQVNCFSKMFARMSFELDIWALMYSALGTYRGRQLWMLHICGTSVRDALPACPKHICGSTGTISKQWRHALPQTTPNSMSTHCRINPLARFRIDTTMIMDAALY